MAEKLVCSTPSFSASREEKLLHRKVWIFLSCNEQEPGKKAQDKTGEEKE